MSADWVNQLAAAHAPPAPAWWPPAPGWWALTAVVVVAVIVLIIRLRRPDRALRRAALRQLRRIEASDADGIAIAQAVQNLLRRYALQLFGYEAIASLTGDAWLDFVISHGGSALAGSTGKALLGAAFGYQDQDARQAWLQAAEHFIVRARRTPRHHSFWKFVPVRRTADRPSALNGGP
jgi:hypothetical protein